MACSPVLSAPCHWASHRLRRLHVCIRFCVYAHTSLEQTLSLSCPEVRMWVPRSGVMRWNLVDQRSRVTVVFKLGVKSVSSLKPPLLCADSQDKDHIMFNKVLTEALTTELHHHGVHQHFQLSRLCLYISIKICLSMRRSKVNQNNKGIQLHFK